MSLKKNINFRFVQWCSFHFIQSVSRGIEWFKIAIKAWLMNDIDNYNHQLLHVVKNDLSKHCLSILCSIEVIWTFFSKFQVIYYLIKCTLNENWLVNCSAFMKKECNVTNKWQGRRNNGELFADNMVTMSWFLYWFRTFYPDHSIRTHEWIHIWTFISSSQFHFILKFYSKRKLNFAFGMEFIRLWLLFCVWLF